MTAMWSSEYSIAEHQDLEATAMAVDRSGVFVLLAGRKCLGLKNLLDASDSLKKFPRHCKYDVGTAEWSPLQKDHCAISTNKKVEVLSWAKSNLSLVNALTSHTRIVTSLNWHQFDANTIATCSIDTFTYVWDLRDSRRPVIAFSTVGTTQVKWNRHSQHSLATAHAGDVRLWDRRKGTAPVQYITAHQTNIHCMDWSPTQATQLATASQDCTVKFFDASNPQMTESMLTSAAPVWRAKYTPFGNGLLMVVIPPMRRRDNSLLLWNLTNLNSPVHSFVGHADIVLEFDWGKRADSVDYQLITWSKDQRLRIWQIEPYLQKISLIFQLCRIDNESDTTLETPLTSINNCEIMSSMPIEEDSNLQNEVNCLSIVDSNCTTEEASPPIISSQPKSLEQEFSLLNDNIPNVNVDCMDPEKRECTITATINNKIVALRILFPFGYPHGIPPTFEFVGATDVSAEWKNKIMKFLKHSAQQRIKKNRPCLESCIRQLVFTLEELSQPEDADKLHQLQKQAVLFYSPSVNLKFENNCIPFSPRTSGAKFCGVGTLICFARSFKGLQSLIRADKSTAYSVTSRNASSGSPLTVSSYYVHDKTNLSRSKVRRTLSKSLKISKATVIFYDVSRLLPIRKDLAEKYVIHTDDVAGMCEENSRIAANAGRLDLAHTWNLAAIAATPAIKDDRDDDFPWPQHPLAFGMVHQLIEHYAKQCDIQMAAMLCCAFGTRTQTLEAPKSKTAKSVSPGGSPYHTHHPVDSSVEGWSLPIFRQNRSNSWSENLDDFNIVDIVVHSPWDTESVKPIRVTLGESWLYDEYKRAYAEILHRWHLLGARAQVMKYVPCSSEVHQGIELVAECPYCKQVIREPYCTNCKYPMLLCIVCHTSVRGGANVCLVCGHGGHTRHLLEWFTTNSVCPSGCGCQCLIETAAVLEP
ncbi:WD repeat domain 59 isoform X2 [Rhodnius prolixus]|uniref:WD repeat domain 59 isoform X2 n=1 Tax=Rhodnius prolixus TaxID=13249 RepID=UPI003D18E514